MNIYVDIFADQHYTKNRDKQFKKSLTILVNLDILIEISDINGKTTQRGVPCL